MPIRYSTTLLVQDEGITLGLATKINFVGAGVTAAISGSTVTVTIPGGISGVSINNTVYIDKTYGNDATGLPERQDRPFLTFAAARTAALAYFVGGDAASATNRILYVVQPGYYQQGIILDNFYDWNLNDATIEKIAGALATIDDNGVAVNCVIYGNGTIKRTTAGTLGGVRCNAGSSITVYADSVTSAIGEAVLCIGGTLTVNARTIFNTAANNALAISGGILRVATTGIIGANTMTFTVLATGGEAHINGDIFYGVSSTGCVLTLKGNILDNGIITSLASTDIVYGNIFSSVGIAVSCDNFMGLLANSQTIYGNVESTADSAASCTNGGVQTITGNCRHTGTGAGDFCGAFCNNNLTFQTINGNCYTNASGANAAGVSTGSGSTGRYNGDIQSQTTIAYLGSGVAYMGSGIRIETFGANKSAALLTSNVTIFNSVTFIATGTGFSVSSTQLLNIYIYGGCQGNKAIDTAFVITQKVNAIVIDANVI